MCTTARAGRPCRPDRAVGVSTGTIKHWFAEGLMDKPAFHGEEGRR
jgi:hypothetical protein